MTKKTAKRRGNNEGSYVQLPSGKWRALYTLQGERKSLTAETKEDAVHAVAMAIADFEKRKGITDDLLVSEWLYMYMTRYMSHTTEETQIGYQRFIDNYLIPAFGKYKLTELTVSILEEGYATMFQSKQYNAKEKEYSHSTLNSVAVFFKRSLRRAVANGLLLNNPHEGVQLHKLRPPKEVTAYTADEQSIMVARLKEKIASDAPYDFLYGIFYFLLGTGMRIGEAEALTWNDVDFEKKTITINKIVTEPHGSPIIKDRTKTSAGCRVISVSDKIIDYLAELKEKNDPEQNFRNLIFVSSTGNFRTSANTRRLLQRFCDECDIEYRGLHALRHTWATRALEAGIDVKKVSAMLGHKNVVTTMNIYQHVLKESQDEVADMMNTFI